LQVVARVVAAVGVRRAVSVSQLRQNG
jgi:hypothetical protein